MAKPFETTQRAFASAASKENHFFLTQRIKELSKRCWGKEIVLLGNHPTFLEALRRLEKFAQSDEPVLITGESGVGKELIVKSLYLLSRRNGASYVCVNCGQFSDEHLMVSELFGHTKGSFTGAIDDHRGVFEMANGGLIFLDEVGELTQTAQKMLLRVIDQKEIRPLGSTKNKQVDIRIVSATHRNLDNMIESGNFREDLFYRLNCLHLHIPALRERGDDCVLLLEYYLNELNVKYGVKKQFSKEVTEFLRQYTFHGNVRELKNIVETGFRVSDDNIIRMDDITTKLQNRRKNDFLPFDISDYYNRMLDKQESFWDVIRTPFLNRELNRRQVKAIICNCLIFLTRNFR
jgi:transcriptional regulator with PAS, ATPase and Fis domain